MADRQINLRLDEALIERIGKRAEKTGRSRNAWIARALEWALEQPLTDRPQPPTKV